MCVLRSEVQECHDGLDGIAKFVVENFFRVCRRVRSQRALLRNLIIPQERWLSPLDDEMIGLLLTLEVLCPRASGLCVVSSDRESPLQYEFWRVCWVNRCNVTASSVMFLSPNRTGSHHEPSYEVTDTIRANLSRLDDRVHSRWKR